MSKTIEIKNKILETENFDELEDQLCDYEDAEKLY